MLSISFDDLRKRHPAFKDAFDTLEAWCDANDNHIRSFEPFRIATWRPESDHFKLSAALNLMVRDGLLRRVFTVRGPDQTLAIEGPYSTLEEIPPVLHGTGDDAFNRADGDIIPVYEQVIAR